MSGFGYGGLSMLWMVLIGIAALVLLVLLIGWLSRSLSK